MCANTVERLTSISEIVYLRARFHADDAYDDDDDDDGTQTEMLWWIGDDLIMTKTMIHMMVLTIR